MILQDNLREIHRAVKSSSQNELPLVANFTGTRIYDKRFRWGRIYELTAWISGKAKAQERLAKAIAHSHTLFQKNLTNVERHLANYKDYLAKSGKGYFVKESDYFTSRKTITQWNKWAKPFVKLMAGTQFLKIEPLLIKSFPDCHNLKALFSPAHAIELCGIQKILDLEGFSTAPLPLAIFKKIMRNKPLNATEIKDLDKWIWKVNKSKALPKEVHKAFKALAEQYRKKDDDEEKIILNAYVLDFYLQERGLTVLQKPDPKHLHWRQQLKMGSKIEINGRELILGQEVHSKGVGGETRRVFNIEGQPDRVALIAQNSVMLPLSNLKMRHCSHFGLEPALMLEISRNGKVAIMEKLKALNSISWTSQSIYLSAKDAPIVNAVSRFIARLVELKQTPKDFSPTYLMLNGSLQLKTLKPAIVGPFDYTALENFIFECAAGNLIVFQSLMSKSGLSQHPVAKFYADLLQSTLKKDTISTADLAAIYSISDPKVVDNGIAFAEKINVLRNQLFDAVKTEFPQEDSQFLVKKIDAAIIACHKSHKTSGTLWPTLQHDALLSLRR